MQKTKFRRQTPREIVDRQNRWSTHQGDVQSVLPTLSPNLFDAAIADSPYGLHFMGKSWDKSVPSTEVWAELLRVCKPGASLLAFGGPRTIHRLACNIEDAGWPIRDKVYWLHGQGFPKSQDIGKALEKRGHESRGWGGYGTALKPAAEEIIWAMKPIEGSFAQNVQHHGCGGLNINGCRIGDSGGTRRSHQAPYPRKPDGSEDRTDWARTGHSVEKIDMGRFPPNAILDEFTAGLLDQQSGRSKSRSFRCRKTKSNVGNGKTMNPFKGRSTDVQGYDDEGGASRFFFVSKANKNERQGNDHPTVKPLTLCEYLARLILPPERETPRRLIVPFSGSGSEMLGGLMAGWDHVTGIEMDDHFCDIAKKRLTKFSKDQKMRE